MRNVIFEQPKGLGMLDAPSLAPRALRDAFGTFATGVTVVTMLDADGRPTGVTVNSYSSLSLEPALCLFSLGKEQVSCRWLGEDCQFIVNVLAEGQEDVAWAFAKPRDNKFDGVASSPGTIVDVPYIEGSLSRFECRIWSRQDAGDHDLFIGQILHAEHTPGRPLMFYRGAMAKLGD